MSKFELQDSKFELKDDAMKSLYLKVEENEKKSNFENEKMRQTIKVEAEALFEATKMKLREENLKVRVEELAKKLRRMEENLKVRVENATVMVFMDKWKMGFMKLQTVVKNNEDALHTCVTRTSEHVADIREKWLISGES